MAALSGIKGTWMHAWMEDRGVCVVCAWSLSCYHILPLKTTCLSVENCHFISSGNMCRCLFQCCACFNENCARDFKKQIQCPTAVKWQRPPSLEPHVCLCWLHIKSCCSCISSCLSLFPSSQINEMLKCFLSHSALAKMLQHNHLH